MPSCVWSFYSLAMGLVRQLGLNFLLYFYSLWVYAHKVRYLCTKFWKGCKWRQGIYLRRKFEVPPYWWNVWIWKRPQLENGPNKVPWIHCNNNYNYQRTILFTKLLWPGNSKGTLWYSSQALTCLVPTGLLQMLEASHCPVLLLNVKQESFTYHFYSI